MIKILDCTLRDGGYYNSWDFERGLIDSYLKAMLALPVDVVEIGFRNMPGNGGKFRGANAFCTDDYIRSLNISDKGLDVGVMVNGSDLLNYSDGLTSSVDRLFGPSGESPVTIVRVACHVHQVEDTLPAIIRLHELGYKTTIQLMQIAGLSREEIIKLAENVASHPLDVVYFADSLGSMVPDDINYTVEALRTYWQGDLGFHAHNNMQGAVANCIRAIELGVTWIDGTVTGMGRGPGNAPTEYLAIELEERLGRQVNYAPLLDVINRYFMPLLHQYRWGPNPYYYMAGKYGIHPTYIQTMINDSRFQSEDMLAVIGHLKKTGGKHYNLVNLEAARFFYSGPGKGNWNPAVLVQRKTVLVLGTGPGAVKYKHALEAFIKKTRPIVIALNKHTPVDQEFIDVRAACHPIRLLADNEDHMRLPQPLIIPCTMLPEDVISLYNGKKMLDYGLTVQENTFEFYSHYCVLPSAKVVAYVLSLCGWGKAEKILLAGFDGYPSEDLRNQEMDKLLKLYMKTDEARPITAITPTRYEIDTASIYELLA